MFSAKRIHKPLDRFHRFTSNHVNLPKGRLDFLVLSVARYCLSAIARLTVRVKAQLLAKLRNITKLRTLSNPSLENYVRSTLR